MASLNNYIILSTQVFELVAIQKPIKNCETTLLGEQQSRL